MRRKNLILQAAIGCFLGLGLIKQDEYNRKLIRDKNAAIMMEYCNVIQSSYEMNDAFTKIISQKYDNRLTTVELLTKSKREKVFVTDEK
jgi:hypothetical protein